MEPRPDGFATRTVGTVMADRSPALRRTPVHIDFKGEGVVRCTVAGVDLPEASVNVPAHVFPSHAMWGEAERGKVFFAYANLNAERPEDVAMERIEPGWAKTDGPLHFDAE